MEEREYLEGHCDLYKAAMMEEQPPLTPPDGSGKRNSPEGWPRPLYSWECKEEEPGCEGKDLNIVIVEVTGSDVRFTNEEEEIPVAARPDESGNQNDVQRCLTRPCWKPSAAEEETEDDEDYSLEILEVVDETNIMKEEEVADVTPADLQRTTLQSHGTLSDTKPELIVQKADGVSEIGTKLAKNHQTVKGDRPFSCTECGDFFKHKSSLVLHRRIHSGVRPFSCLLCSATFIRQAHLVNHQKAHKGLRGFTCPDCGDFFMLRSSLVIHQKIHSAEKPFSS